MSLKPPPVKIIADSKAPASDTDSTLPLAAASLWSQGQKRPRALLDEASGVFAIRLDLPPNSLCIAGTYSQPTSRGRDQQEP
jgi:hypothetical protein